MKETIIGYLSGARPYAEGVALYERFGRNPALKRSFRMNPGSRLSRLTLIEELRKLAGLSPAQLDRIERRAAETAPTPPATAPGDNGGLTRATPGEVSKIRFRDRFPFLKSADCPDILKVLVNDMFTSYDAYRTAHNALSALPDGAPAEETAPLAATAVDEMLNDRMIWDELEHYREHNSLLGEHPKAREWQRWGEYRSLSDFELMRRGKNAASNISKHRAKLKAAATDEDRLQHESALREWITVKEICDQEIENRKKR